MSKNKQNYLAVKAFVYFGFCFPDPKEFIHYICEKTGHNDVMENHLLNKWNGLIEKFGCYAVMNQFFGDIDKEMKEALVEYAVKVYFPKGFTLSEEEKQILGII